MMKLLGPALLVLAMLLTAGGCASPQLQTLDLGDGATMQLVRIPAGTFLMGSPPTEKQRVDNEAQHPVTIGRPFLMGVHHVTRGQFAAFVKATGYRTEAETDGQGGWAWDGKEFRPAAGNSWRDPGLVQDDDHPVIDVSWNDARAFCAWLSAKEKRPFHLPTEAQWEYACRAGTPTPFSLGPTINTGQVNYHGKFVYGNDVKGEYRARTTPVGSFPPNAWGLYDMHGNVWQWCADWYGEYPAGVAADPAGPKTGSYRVVRGGSWGCYPWDCRSAARARETPDLAICIIGFRVVAELPE